MQGPKAKVLGYNAPKGLKACLSTPPLRHTAGPVRCDVSWSSVIPLSQPVYRGVASSRASRLAAAESLGLVSGLVTWVPILNPKQLNPVGALGELRKVWA